ncbi:MAG: TIR domain-containing protein [Sphingomonas sp.]
MSDVFVSYKAEDKRRIRPLVEALQAEGYSVWWDEQIGGGAAWRQAIESELNAAKCVLVAWSKRSVGPDGTFVQDEATRAQQRHVYVPVTIDKVHLPLGFGETQALPLTGWHGDRSDPHYKAVLDAVRRNVGGKRRSTPASPSPRSQFDRRTMITGSAVAAVAVSAVGGWALIRSSPAGASSDSIAVLPFENLSGDPAQAYFSDGIAEEIRSALARIAGLQVVGRTSSEAVRDDDAQTAAKKLAVANILTGSVRQSLSTIRVNAELVDGQTGLDKWSQDYDRSPGDAIKIQTDIAANVASALSSALATVARKAIAAGGTSNAQAQDLLLRAAELNRKGSRSALEQGRKLLENALELDPNYADAFAHQSFVERRLADTYANNVAAFQDGLASSLDLANRAIRLAPTLETGYRARASVYESALKVEPALLDYERAINLAPGDPKALRDYTQFIGLLGRSSEALRLSRKVVAADPLSSESYATYVAALSYARRFPEAIAQSERIRRDSPDLFDWPILLGSCLISDGKLDQAAEVLAHGEKDHPALLAAEAILPARQHKPAVSAAAMKRLGEVYRDTANYQFAEIHAQTGDKEQAFADLNRAWMLKDPGLIFLRADPWLDPLRSDPRLAALVRQIGFPA